MKWLSHLRKFLLARLSKWFPGRVDYIGGADILPAPLSREEEEKLVQELRQDDGAIRATLIEHNLRLVAFIARKFENTNVGIEDLISIGTIGLIKAVNTFDPTKKIKLATYASRCIENEILMYIRKRSGQKCEVSMDEPLNTDWDGNELLLSDVLGSEEDGVAYELEREEERAAVRKAVAALDPRERELIELRYGFTGDELTQKEVADRLGISQSYISRLEKRTLAHLREAIGGKI